MRDLLFGVTVGLQGTGLLVSRFSCRHSVPLPAGRRTQRGHRSCLGSRQGALGRVVSAAGAPLLEDREKGVREAPSGKVRSSKG